MTYFNSSDKEITYDEFYTGLRSQWDPENSSNLYFFHGTKRKPEKKTPQIFSSRIKISVAPTPE